MVKNSYKGLTFYLTDIHSDDLSFLSKIVSLIDVRHNPKNTEGRTNYNDLIKSKEFKELITKKDIFINNPDTFPENTPDEYKQALVKEVNVNGTDLYKIYIPAITQSNVNLRITTDLFKDMLVTLFNVDLLQVQSLTVKQSNDYDFDKGRIEIIKSSRSFTEKGAC